MGEVVDDFLRRLLVGKVFEFDEGFGLGVCEAVDEQPVSPPSRLPWQLKLLQLPDGHADPVLDDHILHLSW